MRKRVGEARAHQYERQGDGVTNAELTGKKLYRFVELDGGGITVLGQAMTELGLSARAYDKVR